jgi:hypothetical protein
MLDRIISPIGEKEFFSMYWEKAPCYFEHQDSSYFSELISFEKVDEILYSRSFAKDLIKITRGESEEFILEEERSVKSLYGNYSEGISIIMTEAGCFSEAIRKISSEIEKAFYYNISVGADAYLSAAESPRVKAHFDEDGIFILQLEGSKRWKVYDSVFPLPIAGQSHKQEFSEEVDFGIPLMEFELHTGDAVYIPRGCLYESYSLSAASLHLTCSLKQKTWVDFFHLLLEGAEKNNSEFTKMLSLEPFLTPGLNGEGGERDSVIPSWFEESVSLIFEPSNVEAALQACRDSEASEGLERKVSLAGHLEVAEL